ncbi:transglutaminase family protein [Lignipirellula cremea]|uniref:Protein-glutamine gamma-glutamyltransferase n=1 Tax=Lignipirellula cremea TaxID=2528010 RepID=A0A518DQ86_9BACT|nr:transglutaminase family protein [Lignipirellula cremea]QDU94001.1 Protein-glutamine gamma-glutamyltransferase [Lignipirellula cremea]
MRYKLVHKTQYSYSYQASVCHNAVHLAPRSLTHQTCGRSRLVVNPTPAAMQERDDYFGNKVHFFAVYQPHSQLTVTAISHVEVAPPPPLPPTSVRWEEVAASLLRKPPVCLRAFEFSFDSPNVRRNEALAAYARVSFTPNRPILEAARELTARVHADFKFDAKATRVDTPVEEVFELKRGVCQDFAHLQIGCLRSIGLAARYVSGYLRTHPPEGKERLVGVDASHAWVSLYCGEAGWVDYDPTNDAIPSEEHITVAWGRDYSDVCPIQGVFVGGGDYTMAVSVDVAPLS